MKEGRFIVTLLTVILTIVQGHLDSQSRRLVSRYNRYIGEPQSNFVYYNQRNTFQQPLESYHEKYNPYRSPIIFKPLENDLSQHSNTGYESLNKVAEETDFALDSFNSGKLANLGNLNEEMSKIEDANKLEDKLTSKVNTFQDELTDEISRFDEEINGRVVRNAEEGGRNARNTNNNEENPHTQYNNDPRIFFRDPVTGDPDNIESYIDANIDDSPIQFVEPDYHNDEAKPQYELDSTQIDSDIKFENGAPEEERKGRMERATSYSPSGIRWNNYNGNYGQEQHNPSHSLQRDYDDSLEAQRETRGYMIGPYRPQSHHHITPDMVYNTGYDRNRGHGGNSQLRSFENGNQREYAGQKQIQDREYGRQTQTAYVKYDSHQEYGSQKQTDTVEYENQRKNVGQQKIDKIQLGGYRENRGQKPIDKELLYDQTEYGGQKQTKNVEFGTHEEHIGQKPTDNAQFGGYSRYNKPKKIEGAESHGQKEYGDQQQTGNIEFGHQREYAGQEQTDYSNYGDQQQTDDVEFGGQGQTDKTQFGGQHQTDDIHFGGQQQTDNVQFGGQQQTDDVEFGGQRQTDKIQFGGQHQTDDVQFGGQQQTDDVEFGSQRQTDKIQFGGQHQTDDIQFGGQQQTDDVQFGSRKQTDMIERDTNSGTPYHKELVGQNKYGSRHASETGFGVERDYGHYMRPDYGKYDNSNPQLFSASYKPGAYNQNPYRSRNVDQSQVNSETQMLGGSRQIDISTYDYTRKNYNPHQTLDGHSAQGQNQQSGIILFNNQRTGNQNNRMENGNKYLNNHGQYEEQDEPSNTKTETKNLLYNKSSMPSPATRPVYQNPGNSERHQQSVSSFGYRSYSTGYSSQPQYTSGYGSHSYPGVPIQRNNYGTPTLINPNDNQRFSEQTSDLSPEEEVSLTSVNRYKKVESLLDDLEKDLIEQKTDKSVEGFIPTVEISRSTAYTSANRYMESPTDSQISYTPYPTPMSPQFEYNSDEEEEEKPSFWSNLGSKIKTSYKNVKDKTKQVLSNIQEKIA